MNKRINKIIFIMMISIIALTGCQTNQKDKFKFGKKFKHNEPLIKTDVKALGKVEVDKTVEMGPTPVEGDVVKLNKRKKISSVKEKNYLLIPDDYDLLKQNVTFKFQNLDYKEAMNLMSKIGDINIMVGEDVAGSVSAELNDVPWDKAFNALLDIKSYAADIDVASNIIRVATPSTLTSQESYKSARASAVKKKIEIEDSVEPIVSEIFRLYYISPAEAKATMLELFTQTAGTGSFVPIQVTEENTTRSIIVRGKEKDLDVVDKVIREIDVRTKQVLIEAFIVDATSKFEKRLAAKLGGAYSRKSLRMAGTGGDGPTITSGVSGSEGADFTADTAAITGAGTGGNDGILNFNASGNIPQTAGLGILKKTPAAILRVQLEALQSEQQTRIISNPKLFSLNNQAASITQGIQIQVPGSGDSPVTFKDAALKMQVTPNIIGDGNILLDIQVNNDSPGGSGSINTMEIQTKLLIADGDIVVIGGIKKNIVSDQLDSVPGLNKVPVLGKIFSGKSKEDDLTELLVFIAPRVL